MKYRNEFTANISFPLGGIGSGSIGLAGNGALVDWEIFGRPDRESINPFSGFAVKAEDDEKVIDFRMLNGDIYKDFMGGMHIGNHSWGYGHGPNRAAFTGLKHFENIVFTGEFPVASISYKDERFPGEISLESFNPFIPSDDKSSSLPTAFFDFRITNTSDKKLTYTVALNVSNPFKLSGKNEFTKAGNLSCLTLNSNELSDNSAEYGNITLSTDNEDAGYQQYWFRGGWFDDITMFLNDFGTYGKIKNRVYDNEGLKHKDIGTLTASVALCPGESKNIRFNLSWFVPNMVKYRDDDKAKEVSEWKHYYASLFDSSLDVAEYCGNNYRYLREKTLKFKEALFGSDLPPQVIDAIQGNLATLKSSTCLRLENGEFWAFEGVNKTSGSCEGTCMHVWNYAYALPFLFPKLEKGIRDYELKYNLEENGRLHFRTMLPLGSYRQDMRACVDGQMGTVMKIYREWKLSGDTEWLRSHWDDIQKCIEFAWNPENEDKWDQNKTGVIHGRQHNTLDVELFGVNSWLSGFYLGALEAGAEIAEALGDTEKEKEYHGLFLKGQNLIEKTFNDKLGYYVQKIDVTNGELLKDYDKADNYWSSEIKQIKYQVADGCEIDQVAAGWHAELMGLPPIFDSEHRKKALQSIYRNNFVSMRDFNNPCRVFACNGEKGVMMCSYPDGAEKPKISVPYTEEFMSGFEYAAASNMLQCGMETEALSIVSAVRDRYDGKKRNPWAEIECGASYARAMSSYSFLLTYSGFIFDMVRNEIGFRPIHYGKFFWSADGAWGTADLQDNRITFEVLYGEITLKKFAHYLSSVGKVKLNEKQTEFSNYDCVISLNITMTENDSLVITV